MNLKNYNFDNDGFCLTGKLPIDFIKNLKNTLSMSNYEQSKLGNTDIKIFSLDLSNQKIIKLKNSLVKIVHENTKLNKSFLKKNFQNKVYLTTDNINSRHRNQIFHYDSYPSIKIIINLSDNSEVSSGATMFLKGSLKSSYLKKINFLRYFYVPGKYGMKNKTKINKLALTYEKIISLNDKYSGVIFNTDTLHCATHVTKKNFNRINVIFSFKQKRKFGVHLDYYIYSKISNFYLSFFN